MRFFRVGALLVLLGFSSSSFPAVFSIGHRGDSLYAPENTLAGFESAVAKHADLVELDTYLSADGQIVVMHDSTVDRTTDGTGSITLKTLAELKALDAGSWFSPAFAGERIPTLEESLAVILPESTPLIERKGGAAAAYAAELRRLGVVTNVVVQAFDWNFLAALHALEPGLRLGALGSSEFTGVTLTNILNSGATIVAWEKARVTPEMLGLVRDAGLSLFVWTVDGPAIRTFIDMGVDGIISNDPGMVENLQEPATNGPVNLPEGLLAYWRMDDGFTHLWSAQALDSKGASHATMQRFDALSHWPVSGIPKIGGCVHVDGTNAFLTVPQSAALDLDTNAITLSVWARLTALPSQLGSSFAAIYDSTTDCYVLYLDKGNKELRFKVTDAAGHAARPGIPEALLRTNEWLHVAAAYSGSFSPAGGQAVIYLNGQPIDAHNGSDSSSPTGLTGKVKSGQVAGIGREGATGGSPFTGYVDDLAVWSRALNPSEVARLFEAGTAGMSLGDLVRQPSGLLSVTAVRLAGNGEQAQVDFVSNGPWTTFRLLRSGSLEGPFLPVYGLQPASLGAGSHRFTLAPPANTNFFYRVEAQ